MKFKVELRMFRKGQIRIVTVPNDELKKITKLVRKLDLIFKYGQNDFQPKRLPSVSMGDVIQFERNRYLIRALGFRKLKPGEFTKTQPKLRDVLK